MDIKEHKINKWLETPISDDVDYMDFCEQYVSDLLKILELESYTIVNVNQLRDEIIEIIYN